MKFSTWTSSEVRYNTQCNCMYLGYKLLKCQENLPWVIISLIHIIVNKRQWLWNLTKFFVTCFCEHFWPWLFTNHNRFWNVLEQMTNRNVPVKIFNCSVIIETKDCAWSQPFQHKLQHHCFQAKISLPVPRLTMSSWPQGLRRRRRNLLLITVRAERVNLKKKKKETRGMFFVWLQNVKINDLGLALWQLHLTLSINLGHVYAVFAINRLNLGWHLNERKVRNVRCNLNNLVFVMTFQNVTRSPMLTKTMLTFAGKISLTIPWTNPYSEPYEITVHDVYLIAGPIRGRLDSMP